MSLKRLVGITSCILLAVAAALGAAAEDRSALPAPVAQATPRLLILDCTKTFESTMRVGGLTGFLRASGAVDVVVQFCDAPSVYDTPDIREDVSSAEPFDVIIIVPCGIDDGTADRVWIVTNVLPDSPQQLWEQVVLLRMVLDEAFTGLAHGVDPTVDLWAGFTASLYASQGWLR